MLEKAKRAIRNPDRVPPYTRYKAAKYWRTAYRAYVRRRTVGTVQKRIQGSLMELSVDDPGISTGLVFDGVREPRATAAYRRELRRLAEARDDVVTVLDVGANVDYYALMPVADHGPNARVVAIEADADNVRRVGRNVKINGYDHRIDVVHAAAGSTETSAELIPSDHSNRHSMQPQFAAVNEPIAAESVEIGVAPVDRILVDRGISPEEIDVVRMDVKGYEASVFRGLEAVLAANESLLSQFEIRPVLMSDDDNEFLRSLLEERDVEVVSSAQNETTLDDRSLEEAWNRGWGELVLR